MAGGSVSESSACSASGRGIGAPGLASETKRTSQALPAQAMAKFAMSPNTACHASRGDVANFAIACAGSACEVRFVSLVKPGARCR